ncbi:unnamed protein product [Chilo suppressalis]|uniref:Signal recognition particle subunit SRP72 n=2 Tax=Chilo suppressalis TaxID=168631 RepID=A0ABN8LDB3_CHISP|nr:unnamed protein product [Chilo suppressalis]
MSANKENNLVQAYIELNKFCQSGDYERALKATGKILQIAPNEQKAFHCKVVCFIQLHNFKEALAILCNPKNAALAADLHFEKAYTQYRLNCPKDALQTVDNAPEMTPALKELRAQILYRLEQYQECYNLYRDLVKNTTDDYEDERKTNMAAVVANLATLNPSTELPQFDETTYELAYNSGSTLAMRGKHNEALPVLKRAEQACSESVLDDGGTDEEAKEEAAIIRVQQAYCLQMMGKEKEAAAIYQNVLKDKPSDQALVAIASNNLVVINRDGNVFDSRKRMKAATADGLEHKLNSRQRSAITYNQAILCIYSNQPDFCKQCCVKLVRDFPGQESRAALVEASSLAKEGKRSQAVSLLLKHGGTLTLAAVQVLLSQGDRKGAVKLLEESEFKYRAGVVGLLCTLLSAEGELEKASKLFHDVYEHYKDDKEALGVLREVWRAAAEAHARAGDTAAAAGALEALARAAPQDTRSLARLVKALAALQPARARLLAASLPALTHREAKIDIDALESSKWMMGAKVVKKTVSKQEQSPGTPGSELGTKKNTRRKRKTKLPPNADLSKPPDPERWLPKYERTAYRKRRGVRRDVIKGSQGMSTTATDQYDMSKQQPTAAAATAAKSPRVEPKQQESAWQRKQQQKKKGKGRKW